ncbi:hypothetical protein HDK90DRAFT_45013 [Phyllosticta capitalensis]|uniref:Uncharacterized protein n=1 Tax=Phyllosticta capitalensis TaxID=121624 RepID=A0ABR1Z560_9PEZI
MEPRYCVGVGWGFLSATALRRTSSPLGCSVHHHLGVIAVMRCIPATRPPDCPSNLNLHLYRRRIQTSIRNDRTLPEPERTSSYPSPIHNTDWSSRSTNGRLGHPLERREQARMELTVLFGLERRRARMALLPVDVNVRDKAGWDEIVKAKANAKEGSRKLHAIAGNMKRTEQTHPLSSNPSRPRLRLVLISTSCPSPFKEGPRSVVA